NEGSTVALARIGNLPLFSVQILRFLAYTVAPGGADLRLEVSCNGRWGRRRVRVSECAFAWTAERVYDALLEQGGYEPGRAGYVEVGTRRQRWVVLYEVRPNAIWRAGRLFFQCPRCCARCTRLYAPLRALQPRCRRCWGLTYECQQWNYKGGLWKRLPAY